MVIEHVIVGPGLGARGVQGHATALRVVPAGERVPTTPELDDARCWLDTVPGR